MRDEQTIRKTAAAAGRTAERLVAFTVARLEDLSLCALEQAAGAQPESERLRMAEQRLNRLRSFAAPLPRIAGRVAAGSTYFGIRWSIVAADAAKEIRGETSAFLNSDPGSQED